MLVRAAIGSLAVLGLVDLAMTVEPTTLYLLQYSKEGCLASCAFCPQSRLSRAPRELVSRIPWPVVELDAVMNALRRKPSAFKRICFQTVIKPGFEEECLRVVELLSRLEVLISVATTPVPRHLLESLRSKGVDRLGIGLDAASPRVFEAVSKPHSWEAYIGFVEEAVAVFGQRRVHVHLIVGLGETGEELLRCMEHLYDLGAEVALFAFTPVKGTPLEDRPRPPLAYYRAAQVARYALSKGLNPREYVEPSKGLLRVKRGVSLEEFKEAFLTSGCPGCNRPFYNERPGGLIYNYPSVTLLEKEFDKILKNIFN